MGVSKQKDKAVEAAMQRSFASNEDFFPGMESTLREMANFDIRIPDWMLPKKYEGLRVGPGQSADAMQRATGFRPWIDDTVNEARDESAVEIKAATKATENLKNSIVVLAGKLGKYDATSAKAAKKWEKANLMFKGRGGDMIPMDSGRLYGVFKKFIEEKNGKENNTNNRASSEKK